MGDEIVNGVAAHPDGAAVAVGVAQHRVRGDDAFEPAVDRHCYVRANSAATLNTSQLAIMIVPPVGAAIGNKREPM